jgi:hypothetical protein
MWSEERMRRKKRTAGERFYPDVSVSTIDAIDEFFSIGSVLDIEDV